jgi:hypothetical protein
MTRNREAVQQGLPHGAEGDRNPVLQGILAPSCLLRVMQADRFGRRDVIAERARPKGKSVLIGAQAIPARIDGDIVSLPTITKPPLGVVQYDAVSGVVTEQVREIAQTLVVIAVAL